MEINDVILVVVIMAIFTVIIAIAKSKSSKKIGIVSMTSHALFLFKVGIMKVDGKTQFSMIIENFSDKEIVIKDMYFEIKEGNRYQKHELPNTFFDSSKDMKIPASKSGASFIGIKELKRIFKEDKIFRAVVEDSESGVFKSKTLNFNYKKTSIS